MPLPLSRRAVCARACVCASVYVMGLCLDVQCVRLRVCVLFRVYSCPCACVCVVCMRRACACLRCMYAFARAALELQAAWHMTNLSNWCDRPAIIVVR